MLEGNAGTQNEGRRDSKANVEAVHKTRIEDKRETKTKGEKSRTQSTALCVGLICPASVWNSGIYEDGADHRIILETMSVPKREHEAKSNGDRGGNQT